MITGMRPAASDGLRIALDDLFLGRHDEDFHLAGVVGIFAEDLKIVVHRGHVVEGQILPRLIMNEVPQFFLIHLGEGRPSSRSRRARRWR